VRSGGEAFPEDCAIEIDQTVFDGRSAEVEGYCCGTHIQDDLKIEEV
jgi:hypothetical protein